MKLEPKKLEDGSVEFRFVMTAQELEEHSAGIFDLVEYCVECKDRTTHNIEARGDVLANIEAAATCLSRTGDPSFSLRVGRCG